MARDIEVTDGSAAGDGTVTIATPAWVLYDADGTTVLSSAAPPYLGVSDTQKSIKQTITQSDGQTATVTRVIPGRVTNLAMSNAADPVATWTDVGGETEYELHRGTNGDFVPDVAGGTTLVVDAIAANAVTATDTTVAGDGSTVYWYRLVARTAYGYTIGNAASSTPAASGVAAIAHATFDGVADGTTFPSYTPEVGGPLTKVGSGTGTGLIKVLGGNGYAVSSNGGNQIYRFAVEDDDLDIVFTVLRKSTGGGFGIRVRWDGDEANKDYYALNWALTGSASGWNVRVFDNHTFRVPSISSPATYADGLVADQTITYRLRVNRPDPTGFPNTTWISLWNADASVMHFNAQDSSTRLNATRGAGTNYIGFETTSLVTNGLLLDEIEVFPWTP